MALLDARARRATLRAIVQPARGLLMEVTEWAGSLFGGIFPLLIHATSLGLAGGLMCDLPLA